MISALNCTQWFFTPKFESSVKYMGKLKPKTFVATKWIQNFQNNLANRRKKSNIGLMMKFMPLKLN